MAITMTTQYSVLVRNEPGQLARVTDALARAGINLDGVVSVTVGTSAWLKFLADGDAGAAKARLERSGYKVGESPVFLIDADRRDLYNELARSLASAGLNLLGCYGQTVQGRTRLIVAVDRPEAAAPVVARVCAAELAA